MGQLFGTDGIRGEANRYPLVPEVIVRIGQAIAVALGDQKEVCMVVGGDTRISSSMIVSSINSGLCSWGVDVLHAGTIPTPAVACLTAADTPAAGIVISASHNPYGDNGIKIFDKDGYKLSDEIEARIEEIVLNGNSKNEMRSGREIGRVIPLVDAEKRYLDFLLQSCPDQNDLKGLKLVIDCANGATSRIAPVLFESLGVEVTSLFIHPDGKNINAGCGSEHSRVVARKVKETGADLGVAFDGDGDRLVAVDETGQVLTGDQILSIFAHDLKSEGRLRNNIVISTVMSNIGLSLALNRMGIDHKVANVGDRRVMEMMRAEGAVLGGEDSGHIILLDRHTTGDGLLSALCLLDVMVRRNKPLSELTRIMTVFPQTLLNVTVSEKPDLSTLMPVQKVISEVNSDLREEGRVLVRYSGTQPMCRIMVEGPSSELTEKYCRKIAEVVLNTIGNTS